MYVMAVKMCLFVTASRTFFIRHFFPLSLRDFFYFIIYSFIFHLLSIPKIHFITIYKISLAYVYTNILRTHNEINARDE